jgi:hypothetical protein
MGHIVYHATWRWSGEQFSPARDVIGLGKSKSTGKPLHKEVVVRQFARTKHTILAGANSELDTTNPENHSELKKEAEENILHRMAKVHDRLEMWLGSPNLSVTQREFCTQNKQMTAIG